MADDAPARELLAWLRPRLADHALGERLGQGYQATVTRYETPAGSVVVKRPHGSGLRGIAGRAAVRREHRVYERLVHVPGVPRCFGLLDGRYLVLEHVDGPSLRSYESRIGDREAFYARLLETLDAMHAAGVAHGDLKRKDNVVVAAGERPYLVDFGIAALDPAGRRGLAHWRFESLRQLDYNAWIKLKYRRDLSRISAADAARYRPLRLERVARWIRIPWQKLTLRRPRQRWKARRERRGP